MKSPDWKTTAEMVGVAAIVASLIFVGIQLKQDRELTSVSSFGSVAESSNALSALVQNQSELWVRGLDGEELTHSEEATFVSMVRAVEYHHTNLFIRWVSADSELRAPESLVQNFATYIYMYPGLRRVMKNRDGIRELRTNAFDNYLNAELYGMALPHLRRLDELAPDIPATKTYVIW